MRAVIQAEMCIRDRDYAMNTAYNVLGIVSSVLGLATAGFGWMTACGAARMKAGRQLSLIHI